jgi:hypothetical protein
MYNNGGLAATGTLAASSLLMQSVWIFLAGFAVLAATVALLRVLPRPALRTEYAGPSAGNRRRLYRVRR